MAHLDYRGSFWFPVEPTELWDTIDQLDSFTSWWHWLREFTSDQEGLVAGNVLHGTVLPPVPYPLRLDVRLETCDRPHLLEAVVEGDVRGDATFTFVPLDEGTELRAAWSLEFLSAPLRIAALVAFPVMQWGHDRVVDMAVHGFRQRALEA